VHKTNLAVRLITIVLNALDKLNSKMFWFGLASVILLTAVVVREVIMRYVFNSPSGVTVEFARSLQMYFGFLCAGYVQREKAHLTMEELLEYVKPRTKRIVMMIGSIFGGLFCGIMIYYSWIMFVSSIRFREVTALLEWPMFWIKLPAVIGFLFLGAQFLVEFLHSIISIKEDPV
jgi:C4-dicarboxylate transporter, DctQ subunit